MISPTLSKSAPCSVQNNEHHPIETEAPSRSSLANSVPKLNFINLKPDTSLVKVPSSVTRTNYVAEEFEESLRELEIAHEKTISQLGQSEILACLNAWSLSFQGLKVSQKILRSLMKTNPLPKEVYFSLKKSGIFLCPLMRATLQHQVKLVMRDPCTAHNFSQDYLRQLSKISVVNRNGNKLWNYCPLDKEQITEQETFNHDTNQFKLFLEVLLKQAFEGQSTDFMEKIASMWLQAVKKQSENEIGETAFVDAISAFWSELMSTQAEHDPNLPKFASLLGGSRQALYVTPFSSMLFCFPQFKLKLSKEDYTICYHMRKNNKISISTSKSLIAENPYEFQMQSLTINVEIYSSIDLIPDWTAFFSLEATPMKGADLALFAEKIVQPIGRMGLVVQKKKSPD